MQVLMMPVMAELVLAVMEGAVVLPTMKELEKRWPSEKRVKRR